MLVFAEACNMHMCAQIWNSMVGHLLQSLTQFNWFNDCSMLPDMALRCTLHRLVSNVPDLQVQHLLISGQAVQRQTDLQHVVLSFTTLLLDTAAPSTITSSYEH